MVSKSDKYIKNNPLSKTDTAIIVTSYVGHLIFLKNTLQKYKETGKYVICSYDRHNDIVPNDIMNIPDAWVFKHETFGAEKRNGWLWDIVYAAGIINIFPNIKYIFTVNGDCIWETPQNIDDIIKLLGDNDIMSASSGGGMIHTCNVIWKRGCFLLFIDNLRKKLNNNIPESYSPEVLLRDYAKEMGIKNKVVSKQPLYPKNHFYEGKVDHYSAYNQDSTWKEILGYRNLGAEHKASCLEHLEPVEKKYIDLRNNGQFFSKHEGSSLYQYYNTGDRRWLYMYYDQGEDSFFNRRYFPLEYYGNKVLHDDSMREIFGPYSERGKWFDRWKYNSYIIKDKEYENRWKKFIKEKGYDIYE